MRLTALLLSIDWAGIATGTVFLVFLDDSDVDCSNPWSSICPTRSVDDIIVGFTAGLAGFASTIGLGGCFVSGTNVGFTAGLAGFASTIGLGGCVVSGTNVGFTHGLTWFDSYVNLRGWDACGILILLDSPSFLWVRLSGWVTVISIIQNKIAVTFEDSE